MVLRKQARTLAEVQQHINQAGQERSRSPVKFGTSSLNGTANFSIDAKLASLDRKLKDIGHDSINLQSTPAKSFASGH